MEEKSGKGRRWWLGVFLLGVLVVALVFTLRPKPSVNSFAFLKNAKRLKSEGGLATVNHYTAGVGMAYSERRRQFDSFQLPVGIDEAKAAAENELNIRVPSLVVSHAPTTPKRSFLRYEEKGSAVLILIEGVQGEKTCKMTVTELAEPTWIDRTVAWFKKIFGR